MSNFFINWLNCNKQKCIFVIFPLTSSDMREVYIMKKDVGFLRACHIQKWDSQHIRGKIADHLVKLYNTNCAQDCVPNKPTCNCTCTCTHMRMPVFTPAQAAFLTFVPQFFSKFLLVKNWVYQWNMQKIIELIFLTMKAINRDTHCISALHSFILKSQKMYLEEIYHMYKWGN